MNKKTTFFLLLIAAAGTGAWFFMRRKSAAPVTIPERVYVYGSEPGQLTAPAVAGVAVQDAGQIAAAEKLASAKRKMLQDGFTIDTGTGFKNPKTGETISYGTADLRYV